jgi:hypothetical protein
MKQAGFRCWLTGLFALVLQWNPLLGETPGYRAEEMLANYFFKYDDFYSESAVFYRGECFAERENGSARDHVKSFSGFVIESAINKIHFASMSTQDLLGAQVVFSVEELVYKGTLWTKAYGGSNSLVVATSSGDPVEKVSPAVFKIQPHGLSLLRDLDFSGNKSNFRRCVPVFLSQKQFVKELEIGDNSVRGVWGTSDKEFLTSIDFSDSLPVKTVWETVPGSKMGKTKSVTITKWKKLGEFDVPSVIQLSGQHGNDRNECEFTFDYVDKERFKQEVKKLDASFLNMKGPWKKVFEIWFNEEKAAKGKFQQESISK